VVFAHARLLGLEDIVSKRSDAPYWHGRCRHWLKVKNAESPAARVGRSVLRESVATPDNGHPYATRCDFRSLL
jgi:hypothetical protein